MVRVLRRRRRAGAGRRADAAPAAAGRARHRRAASTRDLARARRPPARRWPSSDGSPTTRCAAWWPPSAASARFASLHDAVAGPEPLLPLPPDRQRHRRVAGARRRHGRGHRRARRRRGPAGAEIVTGAGVSAIRAGDELGRGRAGTTRSGPHTVAARFVLADVAPVGAAHPAWASRTTRSRSRRVRSSRSTSCSTGCPG